MVYRPTLQQIVIKISTAPTKTKSREPTYSQAFDKNKSDRQRSIFRESGIGITGVDLSKILVGKPKYWGAEVGKSDKCMGDSQ